MVQEGKLAEITDTVGFEEPQYGILLSKPQEYAGAPVRSDGDLGVSFVFLGIFLLFLIISIRFRNNIKYVLAMIRSMVETRTRQNVFDDTVRETSLIVLLNLLWCCCVGILLYSGYTYFFAPTVMPERMALGMVTGMGFSGVYVVFMVVMYLCVGWVFSDKSHSELWLKGYVASQALSAPAMFVLCLIGICMPDLVLEVLFAASFVFILAKMIFIWKGYRIFFNQFSSWVLFLCYLCSLEIVPLVICYRSCNLLGEVLR